MSKASKLQINRARIAISELENERASFSRASVICVSPALGPLEIMPIFEIGVETVAGQAIISLALHHWDQLIAAAAAELTLLQDGSGKTDPGVP